MFTVDELTTITNRANDMENVVANQRWKRAYQRLADAAEGLRNKIERSQDED